MTFEGPAHAKDYVKETGFPWPILINESRSMYHAYGMGAGRKSGIFGPASIWVYFKLMVRGQFPRRPSGDPIQLGGDVLIGPNGVVRIHHVGRGPADRPAVPTILETIEKG